MVFGNVGDYEDGIDGVNANDVAHVTHNGANITQPLPSSGGIGPNENARAGEGSSEQADNNISNANLDSCVPSTYPHEMDDSEHEIEAIEDDLVDLVME